MQLNIISCINFLKNLKLFYRLFLYSIKKNIYQLIRKTILIFLTNDFIFFFNKHEENQVSFYWNQVDFHWLLLEHLVLLLLFLFQMPNCMFPIIFLQQHILYYA